MAEPAVAKDPDVDVKPATTPAATAEVKPGAGVAALQALIAKGPPEPKKVVALLDANRGEHDAMFALLHQALGNAYVDAVTQEMAKLRASLDRKEVVAGDPNQPNAGFFEASAADQGAKWSTKGGGFTGTADKHGLDTHTKVDDHDEIHAKVGADKSATVDWNKDGKTEVEAFGKVGGAKDWSAGVKRDWDLGDQRTLDTKAEHTVAKDGTTDAVSAEYKAGKTTVSGEVADKDGKLSETVAASAPIGKTTLTGSLANDEAGLSEKLGADYKTADGKDEIAGTIAHDPKTTAIGLSETHKFGADASLTSKLEASRGDKGFSGSWSEAYKDKTTSVEGSVAKNPDGTKVHLGATEQLDPKLSLAGNADYATGAPGKQGEASFDLTEKYKSDKLVQSASIEGGTGERDYLNVKGGVDAQLAPKLYGGAWGGASVEAGKQTQAQLGASLTFTPTEKSALTLAGVLDQHGSLETRLQLDVFKSKVNSVGELADHKKDAMVSLFLSYKQSTGASQLDDRYGGASYSTPLSTGPDHGGSEVMAGVKISF